jgi:hypothetical protein
MGSTASSTAPPTKKTRVDSIAGRYDPVSCPMAANASGPSMKLARSTTLNSEKNRASRPVGIILLNSDRDNAMVPPMTRPIPQQIAAYPRVEPRGTKKPAQMIADQQARLTSTALRAPTCRASLPCRTAPAAPTNCTVTRIGTSTPWSRPISRSPYCAPTALTVLIPAV